MVALSFCSACVSGKNHVCKFIGCGRNDKFNYVVMQLQVRWSEGDVGEALLGGLTDGAEPDDWVGGRVLLR